MKKRIKTNKKKKRRKGRRKASWEEEQNQVFLQERPQRDGQSKATMPGSEKEAPQAAVPLGALRPQFSSFERGQNLEML